MRISDWSSDVCSSDLLLRLAMGTLREQDREVRIVDIAAGHGRYILDALQGVSPLPESILLRDYSDIHVRDGSPLILEKGLGDRPEERREGKECVRQCRSRWSPYH